jgi:hypothetical protein
MGFSSKHIYILIHKERKTRRKKKYIYIEARLINIDICTGHKIRIGKKNTEDQSLISFIKKAN